MIRFSSYRNEHYFHRSLNNRKFSSFSSSSLNNKNNNSNNFNNFNNNNIKSSIPSHIKYIPFSEPFISHSSDNIKTLEQQQKQQQNIDIHKKDNLIIPINKPLHITSFGALTKLREITRIRKWGHAGTLDPLATGVLVCLSNRATKLVSRFQDGEKVYRFRIRLGQETPSYDAATDPTRTVDAAHITDDMLDRAVSLFQGEYRQTVPSYSAVRVKGRRLYQAAHEGQRIDSNDLPQRMVHVPSLRITERRDDDVELIARCSKGTFIRSIAHDIGRELNVGAHVIELERQESGGIVLDDCWDLETLKQHIHFR